MVGHLVAFVAGLEGEEGPVVGHVFGVVVVTVSVGTSHGFEANLNKYKFNYRYLISKNSEVKGNCRFI